MNLSVAAAKELAAIGTNRQGATNRRIPAEVVEELQAAKLIGPGLGLTRKGTIARQRIMDAVLDVMF
jgi:hypothetical protein